MIYVGSYGSGISIFSRSGPGLSLVDRLDVPDPSFLVAEPEGRVLYAVDELTDPSVASFQVLDDGRLRELSRRPTGGKAPCHLLRHPAGYLLAANYESGSVSVSNCAVGNRAPSSTPAHTYTESPLRSTPASCIKVALPSAYTASPEMSPNAGSSKNSSARRRRWRPWGSSPAE